jgi:hypothetical protein
MSTGETKHQAARATVAMLCQRWPKCFALKNRRPLKIGIAHDLVRELGDAVSRPELKGALNLYCGHLVYLSTLRAGTSRLDLQGSEVGIVSREDELRAATRLKAAKIARAKARTPATEENVPHQTITPPLSIPPKTRTFAILTTPVTDLVARIHDRMPAILKPSDYERWLGLEPDPNDVLVPFPSELLSMWPISKRVNSPDNDDEQLLDEIPLLAETAA